MGIGKMNERIQILEPTRVMNDDGTFEDDYTLKEEVWAEKKDVSGREYTALYQTGLEVECRFRFRYFKELNETMKIRWKGNLYRIVHPMNVMNKNQYWECLVKRNETGTADRRLGETEEGD